MKVKDLAQPEPLTVKLHERLIDVAVQMREHEVGAFPVLDEGNLVGIISERDVVRALTDGADLTQTPVAAYMTPSPATLPPEAAVSEAASLLLRRGARHIPVLEAGRVVAMLSARDILALEAWDAEQPAPE